MDTESGLVDIVYRVCLMPHRTALNKLTLSWPGYNNKIMYIYLRNERTMGSADRVQYLEGQGRPEAGGSKEPQEMMQRNE